MMKRLVITICVSLLLVSAGLAIGERQVLIEHNKKIKDFKVPHIKWVDVTFRVDYRRIDSKKANISISVHGPHEVVVKPYDIVIVMFATLSMRSGIGGAHEPLICLTIASVAWDGHLSKRMESSEDFHLQRKPVS